MLLYLAKWSSQREVTMHNPYQDIRGEKSQYFKCCFTLVPRLQALHGSVSIQISTPTPQSLPALETHRPPRCCRRQTTPPAPPSSTSWGTNSRPPWTGSRHSPCSCSESPWTAYAEMSHMFNMDTSDDNIQGREAAHVKKTLLLAAVLLSY